MTAATRSGGLRVEPVMGTVVSIDVRTELPADHLAAALDAAVRWFHLVDEVFSTYKDDSWISRLARNDVTLGDCPADVVRVHRLAAGYLEDTDGAFDPYWRGDRTFDPTGLVKGWAAERASTLLTAAGAQDHCVNAAGDVRIRGHAAPRRPWTVGIADPRRPSAMIATVAATDLAVATSGITERGLHVVDPRSGQPASDLLSVTVTGPDLAAADAYATAVLALGRDAPPLLDRLARHGWQSLVVDARGGVRTSPAFPGTVTA